MAVFEYWRDVDLQKPMTRVELEDTLFYGDRLANVIGARVFRNGAAVMDLGGAVHGYVMLSDGRTIAVTGTVSGNAASVTLTEECYSVTGPAAIVLQHVSGNTKTTLLAVRVRVANSRTDVIINGGSVVPDLDDLLARITQMDTATAAAQEVVTNYQTDVNRQDAAIEGLEGRVSTLEDRADTLDDKTAVTVERGSNRYIPRTRNRGKVVYTDGTLHDDARFDTSDYISVSAGETVMAMYWDTTNGEWGAGNPIGNYAFYDANKAGLNIGGASGLGWIYGTDPFVTEEGVEVPSNAAYIRFSIRKDTIDYAPLTAWLSDKLDYADDRDQYWNLRPEIARSEDVTREIASRIAQSETNVKTTVLANIAEGFSPSQSYEIGAKVLYNDHLYECTVPHSGAWDAEHFNAKNIASYLLRFQAVEDDGNITIELI